MPIDTSRAISRPEGWQYEPEARRPLVSHRQSGRTVRDIPATTTEEPFRDERTRPKGAKRRPISNMGLWVRYGKPSAQKTVPHVDAILAQIVADEDRDRRERPMRERRSSASQAQLAEAAMNRAIHWCVTGAPDGKGGRLAPPALYGQAAEVCFIMDTVFRAMEKIAPEKPKRVLRRLAEDPAEFEARLARKVAESGALAENAAGAMASAMSRNTD